MKVSELEKDFFGTQEIKDGSFVRCSEEFCDQKATCFTTVRRGFFKLAMPLCKRHADLIYHSLYNLPEEQYPEAECTLIRTPNGYLWQIDKCPYCLGVHQHGGGKLDGDPRKQLGHRVAHCAAPFHQYASGHGGYMLVEANPNAAAVCMCGRDCECRNSNI